MVQGTITCNIPSNIATSNKYRIRVISTSPFVNGSDNGSDFGIYKYPTTKFNVWKYKNNIVSGRLPGYNSILVGDTIKCVNQSDSAGIFNWNFGFGAIPGNFSGYDPPPVVYTSKGASTIHYSITNVAGCNTTDTALINVYDCNPKIDTNAIVIDTIMNIEIPMNDTNDIWVTTKGILNTDNIYNFKKNRNVFVETGGAIYLTHFDGGVIYVKPGGSVSTTSDNDRSVFIRTPGASLNIPSTFSVMDCNSMKFDYKAAPEKGIIAMKINGVEDNTQNSDIITIYPNPSNGIFNLSIRDINNGDVIITDVLGNTVYFDRINTANNSIDMSSQPKGIYFVKVISGKNINIKKIIVD